MPSETQIISKKIRPYLEEVYRARVIKIHGGPFSESGVADLLCCISGEFVAFEVKKKGNEPTPIQFAFLRSIRKAGGKAGVVYVDSFEKDINDILYDKQV